MNGEFANCMWMLVSDNQKEGNPFVNHIAYHNQPYESPFTGSVLKYATNHALELMRDLGLEKIEIGLTKELKHRDRIFYCVEYFTSFKNNKVALLQYVHECQHIRHYFNCMCERVEYAVYQPTFEQIFSTLRIKV